MALLRCNFFSDVLGMSMSMTVILPQKTRNQIGMAGAAPTDRHPCLYLLHGLSDDDTIWSRRTSIERYVAPLGLAVIMPNVHRSFYTDMAHGYRYWTYISEEIPALAQSFFHISDRREDTFVAGLSMGGYGAFKLGLRRPDRFAAAASLSGCMDVAGRMEGDTGGHDAALIFGAPPRVRGSDDDLFALAAKAAASGHAPRLFQGCGTEDFLHDANVRFHEHSRRLGLNLTYREGPGAHDWGYWDRMIQDVLAWLPLG